MVATQDLVPADSCAGCVDFVDANPCGLPLSVTWVSVKDGNLAQYQRAVLLVSGGIAQSITWTIESMPIGGNAVLLSTSATSAVLASTGSPGTYVVCATSTCGQYATKACANAAVLPSLVVVFEYADADGVPCKNSGSAAKELHVALAGIPGSVEGSDTDCDGQPDPWYTPIDLWFGNKSVAWGAASAANPAFLEADALPFGFHFQAASIAPTTPDVFVGIRNPHGPTSASVVARFYWSGGLIAQAQRELLPGQFWNVGRASFGQLGIGLPPKFVGCKSSIAGCGIQTSQGTLCIVKCFKPGANGMGAVASCCPASP